MTVAIITTDTLHHKFFIEKISNLFFKTIVLLEQNQVKANFPTNVIFEKKRNSFEKKLFFNNKNKKIKKKENLKFFKVRNADDANSIKILRKNNVSFIILFGSKKVSQNFISLFKKKVFNLHGGNLCKYRGLDSHYWAIYHNDFSSLITTLHTVEKKLDTGKIIYQKKIKIFKKDKIYMLRAKNTKICVEIVRKFLLSLKSKKKFRTLKPKVYGRYYSFMPKDLKFIVEKKFNQYLKNLK
jgi:phosphoribosylglycinamide formyltransferase-1